MQYNSFIHRQFGVKKMQHLRKYFESFWTFFQYNFRFKDVWCNEYVLIKQFCLYSRMSNGQTKLPGETTAISKHAAEQDTISKWVFITFSNLSIKFSTLKQSSIEVNYSACPFMAERTPFKKQCRQDPCLLVYKCKWRRLSDKHNAILRSKEALITLCNMGIIILTCKDTSYYLPSHVKYN